MARIGLLVSLIGIEVSKLSRHTVTNNGWSGAFHGKDSVMQVAKRKGQELPRKFYRVPEAAQILGLGKSKTYELVQSGAIRTVRVGRAVRVPASAIDEFAERLEVEGEYA